MDRMCHHHPEGTAHLSSSVTKPIHGLCKASERDPLQSLWRILELQCSSVHTILELGQFNRRITMENRVG
ncbi:hypothetical protein I7I48_10455 [Histoplasma ohiense]|nr:hypothetical protein I7I48_10455 [Histoplasma ohiense (nom. inval.)]